MSVLQYVGARYVPVFYKNPNGTWDWEAGVTYEPMTIVKFGENSYISRSIVPATIGSPNLNTEYWANTGSYNGYINQITQELSVMIPHIDFSNLDSNHDIFYLVRNNKTALFVRGAIESRYHIQVNSVIYSCIDDVICPEIAGAKGDGVNDDYAAFNSLAGTDHTILLSETTYFISNTLKIDVGKCNIIGLSSKSVIKSNASPIIVLYANGSYYNRPGREKEVGNFQILGYGSNDGLMIGGNDAETTGDLDSIKLSFILVNGCNKAIVLNSNIYNMLFEKIDIYDCSFSVYSASNVNSGETIMWLNCSLWHGLMYLTHDSTFVNCTIHVFDGNTQIVQSKKVCHVISPSNLVTFKNCHIERLMRENSTISQGIGFYCYGLVNFIGCIGFSDNNNRVCESLINAVPTSTGNYRISRVLIENCDFYRLLDNLGNTSDAFIGNVIIRGIPYKYDNAHNHNMLIADYSKIDDGIVTGLTQNVTVEKNGNSFVVTPTNYVENAAFTYTKEIINTFHDSIAIKINVSSAKGGVNFNGDNGLVFKDYGGNVLPSYNDAYSFNLLNGKASIIASIPNNCEKIIVGFYAYTGAISESTEMTITLETLLL